ncbi:GNAT family N-acetyltransferase [Caloranaerobacter ferrireducens]|uniref:GNAT family N-acetyltransferase n=1 Tax=Caloranaerobacter ferrireducens TaxID=1323370 RepID=UPI00084D65B7|nr:GNAT family N-acetyltransferase [Caloranaerobacter ferrireducens]
MCLIVGKRVTIRPLVLEDVYAMQDWGKHEEPLFSDYNFPKLKDEEIRQWYKDRTLKKNRKSFGILNENGDTIGYLTIRNIKKFKKQATLGITLDANFVNRGYGTEALNIFLDYFFNELKMKTMCLSVAKFNKRAIRCYEKNGFRKTGEYLKKLDIKTYNVLLKERHSDLIDGFIFKKGNLYCCYYKMELSKYDYCKNEH